MKAPDNPKPRILIADDEPGIRNILHDVLAEDYECVLVGSAEEALKKLRAQPFDLILSDITMEGLSGLEMVPRVLEIAPDAVVIMISGEQSIESAIGALRVGAFDYVTKPFDLQHIEAAVRRGLDHHALRQSKRYYENSLKDLVRQRTSELSQSNHTLLALIEASPLAIFSLDRDARVKMWNPAAERVFGWREREVLERPVPLIHKAWGGTDGGAAAWFDQVLGRGQTEAGIETQLETRDGSQIEAGVWASALVDADGEFSGTMAVVADITERKQSEAKIHHLAFHDTLTELPNRVSFENHLADALGHASARRDESLAVMFISLDRFKKFNDTLGHAMGDQLLRRVAERLRTAVGAGDVLARFGSEEFSLLLASVNGEDEAASTARVIHQLLKTPFILDGQELYFTASVGISLAPRDGDEAQALLRSAGSALFRAKQEGGNNHQFYTAEMNAQALRRLGLESDLRRALEREEFVIHYQPQVCTDTGRIAGAEALVRWRHPVHGLVAPAEFIPLAEDTGLIIQLGEWVLRTACARNREWQRLGAPPLPVAVNLSPRQIAQPGLAERVGRILEETGLDASHLELELTESSIMKNAARAVATLGELKRMGVKIAIDDFGSGYSSLSYLKHLPIDILKIDKSFISELTSDPNDAALVMAIINLAHSLKLRVKAEGVETEEQWRFLRLLRCDEMQGFLFSKPLPPELFERILLDGEPLGQSLLVFHAGAGEAAASHSHGLPPVGANRFQGTPKLTTR